MRPRRSREGTRLREIIASFIEDHLEGDNTDWGWVSTKLTDLSAEEVRSGIEIRGLHQMSLRCECPEHNTEHSLKAHVPVTADVLIGFGEYTLTSNDELVEKAICVAD